ncbi:MAG TPA: hypothetical protein VGJ91_21400, partial [Polyangiaceae bacterium]
MHLPQPAPPARPQPQSAPSHGLFPWRPLLGWASLVLTIGTFAAVRWFMSAPSAPIERPGIGQQPRAMPTVPAGGAPDAWHSRAPVFLKGEGEIPNPVGVAGWPNIGYQLTALLGESG